MPWSLIEEYRLLGWLKEVGVVRSTREMDVFKAECFAIIGEEFERLSAERRKREAKSRKR